MTRYKEKLYLIVEGQTDEKLFEKFKKEFPSKYDIKIINAKGKGNLCSKYKNIMKLNCYSKVYIVMDFDNRDTVENEREKFKLNKKWKYNIFYINPQMELLFVAAKSNKFPINNYKKHIKEYYGIDNYDKKEEQVKKIIENIYKEELITIVNKCRSLPANDIESRGTNLDILFKDLFNL